MNLAHVVDGHDASRVALIDGDDRITFGSLRDRVGRLRAQLAALGVKRGDSIAIAAGNEPHFATAVLALLGLGAVPMPLNPRSTLPELTAKLTAGRAELLLVGGEGRGALEYGGDLEIDLVDLDALAAASESVDPLHDVVDCDPGDTAFHMATSGVSGSPKIAVLSHGNLDWAQTVLLAGDDSVTAADVFLGVLPFAHVFGLNVVLLTSLRAGSCIVLQRTFDAEDGVRLIAEHGITILAGAPAMWQRWADAAQPEQLTSVRLASSGAAALSLGVFESVRDRFGLEIAQGYGLTETSPLVTMGRGHPIRPTSVGKAVDGVTVALVDEHGRPVDVGDAGEIVVRGAGVFQGYLDDPDATDSALTDDGWFWTGDVGVFDDDEYLYLVDRIKDVVIVSGFNVYPAEVEHALMRHPDVTGAIVTGADHATTGEAVVAHVTGDVDVPELEAFIAEQLSRYKRPTRYHVVDELPMAPNGKAIRRALR